jgi:hypothetical protein
MAAKLYCLYAILLGAGVGACLPAASGNEEEVTQADASGAMSPDAPLEIAINQFPGGYQGRWAMSQAACADVPASSPNVISLQGKLVKFHESIGTMTEGKRKTSRTMEGAFEFAGEGKKWTKSIAFELSKDGKSLTRTDRDDRATYRYVQCPKLMAG